MQNTVTTANTPFTFALHITANNCKDAEIATIEQLDDVHISDINATYDCFSTNEYLDALAEGEVDSEDYDDFMQQLEAIVASNYTLMLSKDVLLQMNQESEEIDVREQSLMLIKLALLQQSDE